MGDTVLSTVDNAVCTITLNRPDAMNALDNATKEALRDTVLQAAEDPAVRAVVLTGNGRAFCVGQDLAEHQAALETGSESVMRTVPEHYNPTALALATMPKPVVAAINGIAAGAGASFAFACDFRILAETGGFNLAFAAVGLTADSGASWTLPRLVGQARATDLLMRPRTIKADEAAAIGLVNEVVPTDEVLSRATALATELAAGPTVAYAAIKRSLAYGAMHDFAATLDYEGTQQAIAGASEDHRNGVTAFVAKEKPRFSGR